MESRKRKQPEESISEQQPTPKKFTSTITSISATLPDEDAEEFILNFQKESIWRRMQEYKRSASRIQQELELNKNKHDNYYLIVDAVNISWKQLNDDIHTLLLPIGDPRELSNANRDLPLSKLTETFLENKEIVGKSEIDEKVEQQRQYTYRIVKKLLNYTRQALDINDIIKRKISSTDAKDNANAVELELERVTNLYSNCEKSLDLVQTQYRLLSQTSSKLQIEMLDSKKKLEETSMELTRFKSLLKEAEEKIDRSKCSTLQGIKTETITENAASPLPIPVNPSATVEPGNSILKLDLEEARKLATSRLKELEDISTEKAKIMQELDQYRIKLASLTEEEVIETTAFKNLQNHCNFLKNECEKHREIAEKLTSEIEELKTKRESFLEQMQNEEQTRRKILQGEMKKVQHDLTRIRTNRDHLQQQLERRTAKDDTEFIQNQEIRVIANTRKERVASLLLENRRLKMKIAADAGDQEAVEFYSVNEELKFQSHLQNELKIAEEQIEMLKNEVEIHKKQSSASEDTLKQIHNLSREMKELKERLKLYETNFGDILNEHDIDKSISHKVIQQQKEIEKFKIQLSTSQQIEAQLVIEIDRIGKAWNELEDQNSRKVLDLAQKEDTIAKLLSEKAKYDQKLSTMQKQNTSFNNVNIAMRRQSEKQVEQIRRLEERVQNLSQQLTNIQQELVATQKSDRIQKESCIENIQFLNETKEKLERSDQRFVELNNLLRERSQALENESFLRRRSQEEVLQLNKKMEIMSKSLEQLESTYRPAEESSELVEQLNEYKALLKCNSCNIRFKSHVILRCMHVFCKKCIDSRLETRQRKCPNCSDSFGANDVRQIYL